MDSWMDDEITDRDGWLIGTIGLGRSVGHQYKYANMNMQRECKNLSCA